MTFDRKTDTLTLVLSKQYGYYFFLRDDIDAQLYAQTEASAQAVPLLLRRDPYDRRMAARGEKELFPLTGVPYVVVRVSASSGSLCGTKGNGKKPNRNRNGGGGGEVDRLWIRDMLCRHSNKEADEEGKSNNDYRTKTAKQKKKRKKKNARKSGQIVGHVHDDDEDGEGWEEIVMDVAQLDVGGRCGEGDAVGEDKSGKVVAEVNHAPGHSDEDEEDEPNSSTKIMRRLEDYETTRLIGSD